MIKYLGSKRTLIPSILAAIEPCGASTVLDLFSGTSRVGHALKRAGRRVIANDHNAYAHALAACYVRADAEDVLDDAKRLVAELNRLASASSGDGGWFTETYCRRSRYIHPSNGPRIEAVRDAIESMSLAPDLRAVLLVSLMEAADRVDSTTGLQMAYLKDWAPRAHRPLELRLPDVLPRAAAGKGEALDLDALDAARLDADAAYIDPPYTQHSYLGNYHVWETLIRWDAPAVYGAACKRVDVRDRRSRFNSRREAPGALAELLAAVRAPTLVVSFSDEGFITREELEAMLAPRGDVHVFEHDYPRYVGAKIGIHNPQGEKVGTIGRLRNREYLYVVTSLGRMRATADFQVRRQRAGKSDIANAIVSELITRPVATRSR